MYIYIYQDFVQCFFNNPRMLQDFVYQPDWPCNQHGSGARFLVRNVSKIRNHCLHSGQLYRVASRCSIKNGIKNVLANFNGYIQTTRLNSCHQTVSTVVDNHIASWVACYCSSLASMIIPLYSAGFLLLMAEIFTR